MRIILLSLSFLVDHNLPVIVFHQIKRTKLAFVEHAAQIFADNAQEQQLYAADEEDDGYERRVAWHIAAVEQGTNDDVCHVEDGGSGQQTADERCRPQGCNREARDAFDCQVHELPVVPLRRTSSARIAVKEDLFLVETDPAEQALRVALRLPHQAQCIETLLVEQTEVPDIRLNGDVRQMLQDAIKRM